MDDAPLIKAYDHAKASNHISAAGEFAIAATHTTSSEALRTLKLLEDHHRRIHELLRESPQATDPDASFLADPATTTVATSDPSTRPPTSLALDAAAISRDSALSSDTSSQRRHEEKTLSPTSSNLLASKPPALASLAQRRKPPSHHSSIASNLASARGIPSRQRGSVVAPSISPEQAPGNFNAPTRGAVSGLNSRRASRETGPGVNTQRGHVAAGDKTTDLTASEEGYSRFYNNFSSLLQRISAPLAFAGLPLIAEESSQTERNGPANSSPSQSRHGASKLQKPHRQTTATTTTATTSSSSISGEPELSKIYSKATLRSLARDHPPQDSFYIVPTSGHTVSYANILSRAEKEKRRDGAWGSVHSDRKRKNKDNDDDNVNDDNNNDDNDDEDFVDARETLVAVAAAGHHSATLSADVKQRLGSAKSGKELYNTIEELQIENKTLKDLVDNLSKRLHLFEASSQTSHMALAESMRLMRPGSPVSVSSGGGAGILSGAGAAGAAGGGSGVAGAVSRTTQDVDGLRKRVQELEEQLALTLRDNDKKQKTLNKYREKWEVLKAGAKARREAQGVSAESLEE